MIAIPPIVGVPRLARWCCGPSSRISWPKPRRMKNRTTIGVHGGFIQVLENSVTLITDRAQVTTDTAQAREVAEELASAEEAAAAEVEADEAESGGAEAPES